MIEAKGTREETVSPTAARDRYVLQKAGRRARLPVVLGLFLVGLTAYLKSALSKGSDEASDDAKGPAEVQPEEEPLALNDVFADVLNEQTEAAPFELADSAAFDYTDVKGSSTPISLGEVLAFRPPADKGSLSQPNVSTTSAAVLKFPISKPPHSAGDASSSGRPNTGSTAPADDEDPADGNPDARPPQSDKNRAPRSTGPVYLRDVSGCAAILISVSDLLRNASDPDGDPLSVRNLQVSSGTLTQSDGGWLFAHNAGELGDVTVTYEIFDGAVSIAQTAHFAIVRAPPIIGTAGDDNLLGTLCADDLDAGDGDDNVDGRGGNDIIGAGSGNDHVFGGDGHDVIVAGAGHDIVFGGSGDDNILGGDGDDRLFGGLGDDVLFGDAGNDTIEGGEGNDALLGGDGQDTLKGEAGRDALHGGAGNDTMDGGAGNDVVLGESGDDVADGGDGDDVLSDGDGKDVARGGAGNDLMLVSLDAADDTFDGGEGDDTLDFSEASQSVSVDLMRGVAEGAEIGRDSVAGIECVIGGTGSDQITGGTGDETIAGGDGDDTLCGEAGTDVLEGGAGRDHLAVSLDAANDVYDGGADDDTLDFSLATMRIEVDFTSGEARGEEIGIDTIRNLEKVLGGQGDDLFIIGDTHTVLNGGGGADTFVFQAIVASSDISEVVHEILDFMVGDRINIEQFELFKGVSTEGMFEHLYGDDGRPIEGPIRVRHDKLADLDRTIIEADLDRDDAYEISISLLGHHTMSLHEIGA
jgi:Ca2+-binding RTX toxin-like protein